MNVKIQKKVAYGSSLGDVLRRRTHLRRRTIANACLFQQKRRRVENINIFRKMT
jgi:hypothetical protein